MIKTLASIMMNFDGKDMKDYEVMVSSLTGMGSYFYVLKKLDLDLKIGQLHWQSHHRGTAHVGA